MAVHTCAVCLAAGCGRTAEGEDFFFLLFPFPFFNLFHVPFWWWTGELRPWAQPIYRG